MQILTEILWCIILLVFTMGIVFYAWLIKELWQYIKEKKEKKKFKKQHKE